MTCNLSEDLPWSALLEARKLLEQGVTGIAFAKRGQWSCQPSADASWQHAEEALLVDFDRDLRRRQEAIEASRCIGFYDSKVGELPSLEASSGVVLDSVLVNAARIYLPIIIGAAKAKRDGRSFVAGHLTQTLDGRIACENGQSQWIGNEADLRHSHRMRALLEGVIVGATTALHDNPQLNVRHVSGPDPRRIVVSGRGRILEHAQSLKIMQGAGCEVLVGDNYMQSVDAAAMASSVVLNGVSADDGRIHPTAVLAKLRERGLHSFYLEGGSGTLSSFLQAGCLDVLQIHIASMVLGSGLAGLQLPAIDHVDQGMQMQVDHSVLDGHVLLTCIPHSKM